MHSNLISKTSCRARQIHCAGLLFALGLICCTGARAQNASSTTHNAPTAAENDVPGLPRVLLIGDFVSDYYTAPTRKLLEGYTNVHHIPGSARDTSFGLAHLDEWLGSGKWDVIYFNWGLDDLVLKPNGEQGVPLARYQKNLRELVRRLKRTGAALVWATTIAVPEGIEEHPIRRNSDVQAYNTAASAIMDENHIMVDNLYSYAPRRSKPLRQPDDVEFNQGCADQAASYVLLAEAFVPVRDDPGLPRVLLIGDSISYYYTYPARLFLKGRANIHRIGTNGGNTADALKQLDDWLGKEQWDVIYFNWGLHDLVLKPNHEHAVPLPEYRANLRELVWRLKLTGAKLIWATTTPLPPGHHRNYAEGSELAYNAASVEVMKENHVLIDDLYGYALPRLKEYQRQDDVHFATVGGEALGREVARSIESALANR